MKPTQTVVLLLILVVMVFAVTFASMYVQPVKKSGPSADAAKGGGEGAALRLTFASTHYPERDPNYTGENSPVVSEYGSMAHHDFWFENANDEAVRVGLVKKGCTCSDARVFIAPADWSRELAAVALQRVGGRFGLLSRMVRLGSIPALANPGPLRPLTEGEEGATVPPRGVGFVRLRWEGRATSPRAQILSAKLWMQSAASGPAVDLQVGAGLLDPIQLDRTSLSVGLLAPGDSATGVVRCWSATRTDFGLDIRFPGAPFVACVKEPLRDEDYRVLREQYKITVVSGYRITVTVRERTEDGKRRSDEGPFKHTITLLPALSGTRPVEPLAVTLNGNVRGDISVTGAENGIHLAPFAVRAGTRYTARLTTDRAGLGLTLDRHPPFIKVRLKKLATAEAGGKWELQLAIEPNTVSGTFPRTDRKDYRDTAIYLKIEGQEGRRMRIPVSGEAVQ